MEMRKIQVTGGSSFTVTLPKPWIDRAGIKAGDVVGCAEQADGTLLVVPQGKSQRPPSRYFIDFEEPGGEHIFRKIIAAYLLGFDTIVVRSKKPITPAVAVRIRNAARRIMGLEVVDEEPNAMTLQDFLDPREFHLDKALRRMELVTQAMQEEALGAIVAPSAEVLASLADRDDEVDRLYWLVSKQYHAMLRDTGYAARIGLNASQALNVVAVARIVERTADHAKRLAEQAVELPKHKIPDATLQRLEKQGRRAAELFRGALQTFHRVDAKRANEIIDEAADFSKAHDRLLREISPLGGETVAHLAYILESIARTAAYAADVAETAINQKVATTERA